MIDFKLVYDRRNEAKEKNQLGLIDVQVYLRGTRKRAWFSTKIKVLPSEWNDKEKKVTSKNADAKKHNFYLKKYIRDLEDMQLEKQFKKLSFTFSDVKSYFKHKKEKTTSFIVFVNAEIESDLSVKEKTKMQHTPAGEPGKIKCSDISLGCTGYWVITTN